MGPTGGPREDFGPPSASGKPSHGRAILLVLIAMALLGAAYWGLSETGLISLATDEERLRRAVDGLGAWGPLAIIAIMASAIVFSPIPSAPVAMVAGAAYGPVWGTVFTVIGAEAGALLAFALARYFAYDAVRRWPGVKRILDWFEAGRSQLWLMAIVFGSRLLPFVSFDAVSYAAGLTPLAFWRFAIATLAGVVPVAFLLAYTGDTMVVSADGYPILTVLALGGITLAPFVVRYVWTFLRRGPTRSG